MKGPDERSLILAMEDGKRVFPMTYARTLLTASALALVAAMLVPSASAWTLESAPTTITKCTGTTPTIQTVCQHETVGDYLDCYLIQWGPLAWAAHCV
jgi:hypothetical protein